MAHVLSLLALAALLPACGSAPASAERSVASQASPVQLGGIYNITFLTPFAGPVVGRFELEQTATELRANTRPGAAADLVGDVEGLLGRLISPFIFPSGMLVTWKSTIPSPAAPGEGSIGFGSLPWLRVRTTMEHGSSTFKILFRDDRPLALARLDRVQPDTDPPASPDSNSLTSTNYPALADSISTLMPTVLYDAQLGTSDQTTSYLADLRKVAGLAKDDIEFLTGAALAGRKHVRFAMPFMYRQHTPLQTTQADAAALRDISKPFRVTRDESTQITTLRIDAFVTTDMVDEAFAAATTPPPRALILDLRTCAGFEIESLRAAQWLLRDEATAGLAFGPSVRGRVQSNQPITTPPTTLKDSADFAAARATLLATDALALRVVPRTPTLDVPVALLTSRRTSSTAEWLVSVLKRSGRVRTFGEPTAGRPYLSKETPIGQGWVFRTASYDFLPTGTSKLASQPIDPDQRTGRDAAEQAAKQWLLKSIAPAATPAATN